MLFTMRSPTVPSARVRLIQVVPPGPGGVRDYADALRNAWTRRGLDSEVMAFDREAARERPLRERLVAVGRPHRVAVLLHVSGYGYERRALFGWLLREVFDAQHALGEQLHLLAMFHELSASGPPWRSAFWLGGLQARLVRSLAQAADAVCTNTQRHVRFLRGAIDSGTPFRCLPVFSTIGEAVHRPAPQDRGPALVAFGSQSTRRRALSQLHRHGSALQRLGIRHITEIGSGESTDPRCGLPHRFAGQLSAEEVSRQLLLHRWGLLDYPASHFGKSTVFAAYAAHGCVTLNVARPVQPEEGLEAGRHFMELASTEPAIELPLHILAQAASDWYAGHTLERQSSEFLELLQRSRARRAAQRSLALVP